MDDAPLGRHAASSVRPLFEDTPMVCGRLTNRASAAGDPRPGAQHPHYTQVNWPAASTLEPHAPGHCRRLLDRMPSRRLGGDLTGAGPFFQAGGSPGCRVADSELGRATKPNSARAALIPTSPHRPPRGAPATPSRSCIHTALDTRSTLWARRPQHPGIASGGPRRFRAPRGPALRDSRLGQSASRSPRHAA